MNSYVMFQDEPTIRGPQSEVEIAAEAYVKAKCDAGSGAVLLGSSPGLESFMLMLTRIYSAKITFELPDYVRNGQSTVTEVLS